VQYSYTFLARTSRSLAEVEEHSENSERIRIFQFVFVAPLDRIEKARGFFQWRRDNKKNSTELCKKTEITEERIKRWCLVLRQKVCGNSNRESADGVLGLFQL
jgi:hypothetical protein